MVDSDASSAQKTGRLEPPPIEKVRGFGDMANGPDSQGGLAGDCVKGEAFRDALEGVLHAKVRKFGIEIGAVDWKCPADRDLRRSVYRASDC
jgi:hypothetical protein